MNSIRPNFAESSKPKLYDGTITEQHAKAKDWNLDPSHLGSAQTSLELPQDALTRSVDPNSGSLMDKAIGKAQTAVRTAAALVAETKESQRSQRGDSEYCLSEHLLDDNLDGSRACNLEPDEVSAWEHRIVDLGNGSKEISDIAFKSHGNQKQYAIRDSSGAYVVSQNPTGALFVTIYDVDSEPKA